jgi:hypothetical protein
MSTGSVDDERAWAAEKREFVADRRDWSADERDTIAAARDRIADVREAELDEWERRLQARAEQLGLAADPAEDADRDAARAARGQAGEHRDEAQAERDAAAAARDESAKRRQAEAPPARLAMAFAEIAAQLYDADDSDEVLLRIAQAAVTTVAGCRMASVTLAEGSGYRTAASTDPAATAVDQAQYRTQEGPCLDAIDAPVVSAPSFPDQRWPALAALPTEFGVQSALSYQLTTASGPEVAGDGGSLNSYGVTSAAFDDSAREIGLILAAHASLALRAVGERTTLRRLDSDLQQLLLTRDVIGQAKGILMERLKITPEDAFDLLRRSSQRLNVKLREVARGLADTGELVEVGTDHRAGRPAAGAADAPATGDD